MNCRGTSATLVLAALLLAGCTTTAPVSSTSSAPITGHGESQIPSAIKPTPIEFDLNATFKEHYNYQGRPVPIWTNSSASVPYDLIANLTEAVHVVVNWSTYPYEPSVVITGPTVFDLLPGVSVQHFILLVKETQVNHGAQVRLNALVYKTPNVLGRTELVVFKLE
jgi:hypothetical protein